MTHTQSHADRALAAYLPLLEGRTVLVLGDVMLDRYVEGDVRRISPEAPIPILRAGARRAVAGGAANVAQNIAALGARAVLVGIVGTDDAGAELAALLAPGVESRLLQVANRPTTVKTRFVSDGHQLLRLDEENTGPVDDRAGASLLASLTAVLPRADVLVLSDYAKGVLTDAVLEGAIAAARAAGKPVIADPKRPAFHAYRQATVLTPNESEVSQATGIPATDDAGAAEAGRRALDQSQADAALVTRSEKGLTLVQRGHTALHVPTRALAVSDVSGAGDTLIAALAVTLACGASLPEAAAMANVAAGIAVSKPGTATVTQHELAEALHRQDLLAVDEKVMDLPAAQVRVAAWRGTGLKVGFTNGCFDLIHPGHVRLLQRARAACDRLVVALNTDASVRRLKGPERPVQSETARATVMASMSFADLVVLFDEDTPERLIRALRPDMLFKGADYRLDQVVGADIVQGYGGEVRLIPLEEGFSTTGTIRRINAGR